MDIPFFSVIIPTYNRAQFLPRTINSVLTQTFDNWELIIIDDGSTDNTKAVVETFMEDKRIRYIHQENQERSISRNNGAKHSRADYLCFLDSDDEYLPNHLQLFHDAIISKNYPKGMLFTGYIRSDGTDANTVLNDKVINNYVDFFYRNPVIPARVCLSKEIFDHYSFDNNAIISEDMILWMEVAHDNKYDVIQISTPSIKYNLHGDNSVNYEKYNGPLKQFKGMKQFFKRAPHVRKALSKSIRKDVDSEIVFNISKHYMANKKFGKAIKYIIHSILIHPTHIQTKYRINTLKHALLRKTI